jgi:hypothetical protein
MRPLAKTISTFVHPSVAKQSGMVMAAMIRVMDLDLCR